MLRQLSYRPIALDGGQRHLRLEGRCVVPARSSAHGLSCSRHIVPAVRQKLHLSAMVRSPLMAASATLALKAGVVVPARSSVHRLSCSRRLSPAVRQKLHLSSCSDFRSRLSPLFLCGSFRLRIPRLAMRQNMRPSSGRQSCSGNQRIGCCSIRAGSTVRQGLAMKSLTRPW